jgi:3-methyladenine DNA glycosylase AlkD
MTTKEIIKRIKANKNERAVEIWKSYGVTADEFYGMGLTQLRKFSKEIKKNHDIALELWETKIHDAKLLSTMIEEYKKVDEAQIDKQVREIYSPDLADKFCEFVAKTPFTVKKIKEWCGSNEEFLKRCGFILFTRKSKELDKMKDEEFEKYLNQIEKELQKERNWVKEAMNYALISIGSRNKNLNKKAMQVAKNIGAVEVDYGETSCKTTDPVDSLKKVKAKLD